MILGLAVVQTKMTRSLVSVIEFAQLSPMSISLELNEFSFVSISSRWSLSFKIRNRKLNEFSYKYPPELDEIE